MKRKLRAQTQVRRAKLRLWALLFGGFLVVGVASAALIISLTVDRFMSDMRSDLSKTAQLIALQVDGDTQSRLVDPEQMDGKDYKELSQRLADAKRVDPKLKFVYTMRVVGEKVFFLVDPTPAGDSDGDGVDDKSYLMDEYPEATPLIRKVQSGGAPMVEPDFSTDRWGTFLSAYAPIRDSKGRVVGILGIDREAGEILAHIRRLQNLGLYTLLLVFILGGGYSLVLVRQFLSSGEGSLPGIQRLVAYAVNARVTVLEFTLAGLSISVLLVGILAINSRARTSEERQEVNNQLRKIDEVSTALIASHDSALSGADKARLSYEVKMLGYSSQAHELQSNGNSWKVTQQVLERVSADEAELRVQRDRLDVQDKASETQATIAFIVATFLALGSLILLRGVVRQHLDLVAARAETDRHRVRHAEMATNLPVGLFTYRNGEIDYSNPAWNRLVGTEGHTATEALFAALPLHNQERVRSILALSEESGQPFEFTSTLKAPDGIVRTVEAEGVHVAMSDDEPDYLLGFLLDVTERVEANAELQSKHAELEVSNEHLRYAVDELQVNFEATLQALVKAVEAKDKYTAGHSERVMSYSVAIGKLMGLSAADLHILRMGSLVHDVGKIGIPDGTLTKTGKLTDEEFAQIRSHAEIGARLIEGIPTFGPCVPIVRHHHERLNGRGYPDGLSGDEIPMLVRIVSAADAFDAMTSTRAYRHARSGEEALRELEKDVLNGSLDPEVVQILSDIVKRDGVLWVSEIQEAA